MTTGFLKKPVFWIGLIIVPIIGLLIFALKSNIIDKSKISQKSSQIASQSLKSGPKPGNCLVLEQKYCSQGSIAQWKNPAGINLNLAGFSLPADVPIFSPIEGVVASSDGPGNLIDPSFPIMQISQKDNPVGISFMVSGNIRFDPKKITAQKGEIIAYTITSENQILESSVVATATHIVDSEITISEDLLSTFLNK